MNLLYVSFMATHINEIQVYSYLPARPPVLVCTISGVYGDGMCSDAAGNVYIPTGFGSMGQILEYAHGGTTPIRTFSGLNFLFGFPDCAVDPTTGDLAVTISGGQVDVFDNVKGRFRKTPHVYYWSQAGFQVTVANCTYDSSGNLYIDAQLRPNSGPGASPLAVGELPVGGTSIATWTYPEGSNTTGYPGGIQWDGAHIVVGDWATNRVYILAATITVLTLRGAKDVHEFWIGKKHLVGGNYGGTTVDYWAYPAGGRPGQMITTTQPPWGVTVSLGSSSH